MHLLLSRPCSGVATEPDNDVFLEQFTEEKVNSPAVRKLLAKAEVTCDPSLDAIELEGRDHTTVRWHLKDGRVLEEARVVAKGHPDDPMSEGEIRAKFHRLMDDIVGTKRAEEIEVAFDSLDKIDSFELQRVLTSPSSAESRSEKG
jgi:2-methylcitrate dehydratase PrpD